MRLQLQEDRTMLCPGCVGGGLLCCRTKAQGPKSGGGGKGTAHQPGCLPGEADLVDVTSLVGPQANRFPKKKAHTGGSLRVSEHRCGPCWTHSRSAAGAVPWAGVGSPEGASRSFGTGASSRILCSRQ